MYIDAWSAILLADEQPPLLEVMPTLFMEDILQAGLILSEARSRANQKNMVFLLDEDELSIGPIYCNR